MKRLVKSWNRNRRNKKKWWHGLIGEKVKGGRGRHVWQTSLQTWAQRPSKRLPTSGIRLYGDQQGHVLRLWPFVTCIRSQQVWISTSYPSPNFRKLPAWLWSDYYLESLENQVSMDLIRFLLRAKLITTMIVTRVTWLSLGLWVITGAAVT